MRRIFKYSMIVIVFSLLSAGSVVYGLYERDTAKAVEASSVLDYQAAKDAYEAINSRLGYVNRIPFVFDRWRNEITVKRSEAEYWKKNYAILVNSDEVVSQEVEVTQLAFVRGNAEYRSIESEKNRRLVIEGIERAINDYTHTVKSDPEHFYGAFNYEYLLMLRDQVASGKRPLPLKGDPQKGQKKGQKPGKEGDQQSQGMHGQEGAQAQDSVETKIKIHVPIDSDEAKEKGGTEAGKGDAKRGKG